MRETSSKRWGITQGGEGPPGMGDLPLESVTHSENRAPVGLRFWF